MEPIRLGGTERELPVLREQEAREYTWSETLRSAKHQISRFTLRLPLSTLTQLHSTIGKYGFAETP